jgi:hypothetical protein
MTVTAKASAKSPCWRSVKPDKAGRILDVFPGTAESEAAGLRVSAEEIAKPASHLSGFQVNAVFAEGRFGRKARMPRQPDPRSFKSPRP